MIQASSLQWQGREGAGFLDIWVQERCSWSKLPATQLLSSESHHSVMVRPSGLFLEMFPLSMHCPCLGSNPPGSLEVRTRRSCHQLAATAGARILPARCSKQRVTQDTSALLRMAHPGAVRMCFLLPFCLASSLSAGRSVWLLAELNLMFFLPGSVLNADEVWNRAARWWWCNPACVSRTSRHEADVSPLHSHPTGLGQALSLKRAEKDDLFR